jgi:hypothetical protein
MREIEKLISELKQDNSKEDSLLAVHFLLNGYNLGLQDAAELSKLKYYAGETGYLNEESILKLKL